MGSRDAATGVGKAYYSQRARKGGVQLKRTRLDAKDYAQAYLKGIWGAATVPFHPDGTIDEEGFRANLRHWRDELHIDGMFVAGLMSEFWSLTMKDRMRIFEITVEESKDQMLSLLSVCDYNLYDTLELVQYAEDIGGHFAIVMNPRFYAPYQSTDDEIFEYFKFLCDRVNIPVCIFNQEMIMGYAMSPEAIARTAELPNLVGIKNAVGDSAHTLRVRQLCGGKIMVSDPNEANWLTNHTIHQQAALMAGPYAFLLQSREWQPIREYTRLADEGKIEEAKKVSDSLEPARQAFSRAIAAVTGGAHWQELRVMKYWQELLGQVGGCIRPPFPDRPKELSTREKEMVREQFEASGLLKKPAPVAV